MSFRLKYIPCVSASTQEEARNLMLQEGEPMTAVYTFSQGAGRGQAGASWFCGEGCNVAATFVFEPVFLPAGRLFQLDMALSLAILDYTRTLHPDFLLKWPNDLYWHGKKFAGVLIESSIQDNRVRRFYLGIGMNINQKEFPKTLPNPVSAVQIDSRERALHTETAALARFLAQAYESFRIRFTGSERTAFLAGLKRDYLSALLYAGQWKDYVCRGIPICARICDVDEYGSLLLQGRDGTLVRAGLKELEYPTV